MPEGTNDITQVRVDIGEIKGIMNTIVLSHGEQIRGLTDGQKQLRTDLTAVKDNATLAINNVSTVANAASENIKDIREDVKSINDKQNATFGKVLQALSPIIATFALIWAVLGGK